MKKVFMIHGFGGSPNGGWRPWLMGELEKEEIYACSLSMPDPEDPICSEWVEEIARHIERNKDDEIYLVGHSLGGPAILRYLESEKAGSSVMGAVLVSSPSERPQIEQIHNFFTKPFEYEAIKSAGKKFIIIHGDNDPRVPLIEGQTLSKELNGELIVIPNGGHLNGASGWNTLPQALEALHKIFV